MIIGGYVMGATEGIIYVRAEYPLAVHRLMRAIEQARDYGLLGDNILGRDFSFNIQLVEGAGAFVCGEETALIASLEGRAGRPRPRPPFPAQHGLWGKPTNINNVETWYNIAPIVTKGPAWFTETGSPKSSGTKVFSLVGKVRNTGLVEMPLGAPLKTFVYDIGEGGDSGKQIRAVQTGGPSGGCIPHEMFETAVDYESLAQIGSIMGSGGMVVMDEDNCMVDVARYFIEFTQSESCGKCVPCRVGLDQALRILNGVTHGQAKTDELELLDDLGRMIRDCSLCGLGQSAPNPVLTTMRHFRHEFEDHIVAKRCRAGVCEDLALSPCENSCPLHMNIPRFLTLYKEGRLEEAFESVVMDNPLPASTGRVCQHPCDNRCRRQTLDEAVNMREVHRFIADSIYASDKYPQLIEKVIARASGADGTEGRDCGRRPDGLDGGVLPGDARARRHGVRGQVGARRNAAVCAAGIPPAEIVARQGTGTHPPRWSAFRLQHASGIRYSAERSRRSVRCRIHLHRHMEGIVGLHPRHGDEGRASGAAVPGGGGGGRDR